MIGISCANPVFPLVESENKNLLKLYFNDVGIFTGILYQNNVNAILDEEKSINLGSVYETVVAIELKAHGKNCTTMIIEKMERLILS